MYGPHVESVNLYNARSENHKKRILQFSMKLRLRCRCPTVRIHLPVHEMNNEKATCSATTHSHIKGKDVRYIAHGEKLQYQFWYHAECDISDKYPQYLHDKQWQQNGQTLSQILAYQVPFSLWK